MNLKKYYKYTPFIIFFIILLLWHWKLPLLNDDITFRGIMHRHPLFPINGSSYLEYRYASWSSRTLIELNLGVFVMLPGKIWKLLDSVVFVLIGYLITKLSINTDELSSNKKIIYYSLSCLLVGLFIITFYNVFEAAGWVSTTINYTWPFCFALIHFYFLKEYSFKDKEVFGLKKIGVNLILILSLIEAASSEQLLIVMFGIYFFIIIYCLYKKIEIPKILYLSLVVMILTLIYTMICPGNSNRYEYTVKNIYPQFANYTLINKLDTGITPFLNWTMTKSNIITMIFFGIMGIYSYFISNKRKIALLTFIPFLIVLIFWIMGFMGPADIFQFVATGGTFYGLLSLDPMTMKVCSVLYVAIILPTLLFVYLIYKNKSKKFTYIITTLLLIGFGSSALLLGFTPTLSSSGRIFFYFRLILIMISLILIRDMDKSLSKK